MTTPNTQPSGSSTPAGSAVATNTPEASVSGAVSNPAPAGGDAGGGTPAGAEAPKPAADPKGARLLLKQQEAERRFNAEKARLADERAKIAAEARAERDAAAQKLKANPIAFLREQGLSYEDVTKAAIAEAEKQTPEARIAALEAERQAERDAAKKAQDEAAAKAQQEAVQAKITAYVDGIHGTATKDDAAKVKYACVNALQPEYAKGLIYDVADVIATDRQKAAGRMDVPMPTAAEVLDRIEAYLEAEAERLGKARAAKAPKPAAAEGAGAAAGAANGAAAGGENPEVSRLVDQRNKAAARSRTGERPAPRAITNAATQAPTPVQKPGKMSRDEAIKAAIAAGLAAAKG